MTTNIQGHRSRVCAAVAMASAFARELAGNRPVNFATKRENSPRPKAAAAEPPTVRSSSGVGIVEYTAARTIQAGGRGKVTAFITNTAAHVANKVRALALNCAMLPPADAAPVAELRRAIACTRG